MPFRPMRFLAATFLSLTVGCARISIDQGDHNSAMVLPAKCDSGEPAVYLMSVSSRLTGETKRFPWVDEVRTSPVFVEPGTYEIEVGCSRSRTECGRSQGLPWLYADSGPRVQVSLAAQERVELDCDGATSAIEIRKFAAAE